ncbi:MAG TPA: YihY/virulence factor BrkB family protein [Syntrophorhabdaceae bacterium]|nr:YihY/virulence factor BrkB family protein [Syntrophorhabdaceae bacterium]
MNKKHILDLIKECFSEWSKDHASQLAAALAYYTIFSLAPLLVIMLAIVRFVFGQEESGGQVIAQISEFTGPQIGRLLQTVAQQAQRSSTGILASIISIAVLIFAASGVFYQLQFSLNTIWEVESKPGRGIKSFVRKRISSFILIFVVGFLLLLTLAASTGISALSDRIDEFIPGSRFVILMLNNGILLCMGGLLFAVIFKMLPEANVAWKDVWIGAVVTSALLAAGKFAIGLYLSKSTMASPYGAAGSLMILLAFVYYCAQIFFIGAEFTQVYANHYGSKITPSKHAQAKPLEEPSVKHQPSEPHQDRTDR